MKLFCTLLCSDRSGVERRHRDRRLRLSYHRIVHDGTYAFHMFQTQAVSTYPILRAGFLSTFGVTPPIQLSTSFLKFWVENSSGFAIKIDDKILCPSFPELIRYNFILVVPQPGNFNPCSAEQFISDQQWWRSLALSNLV